MPKQKVLFKFGTAAQYAALENKLDNALYFLLDTNELYRGEVPFGQAHVFTGNRQANVIDDTVAITAVVNGSPLVHGDIAILRNSDNTYDAFVYGEDNSWYPLGNSASKSASLATELAVVSGRVSDLESLLNGTPENVQTGDPAIPGLVERVVDLESALSSVGGAFHFKGSKPSYEALLETSNPGEGDVYQVGNDEYAWNGNAWVQLGGLVDLSNYATEDYVDEAIADLEALIGHAASVDEETGEPIAASGIYAELASNPDAIIPIFNGAIAGLVPVASNTLTTEQKANRFLNALGNWVEVTTAGGQVTYTAPDNTVFYNAEDYVQYMVTNYSELYWESMSE